MEAVNLCDKCALNMSNYLNELNKDINIKYKYTMAKWRIERDRAKIKQLEAENKIFLETKTALTQQVMDLTQENTRLKEALKKIANNATDNVYDVSFIAQRIAQKALEE